MQLSSMLRFVSHKLSSASLDTICEIPLSAVSTSLQSFSSVTKTMAKIEPFRLNADGASFASLRKAATAVAKPRSMPAVPGFVPKIASQRNKFLM